MGAGGVFSISELPEEATTTRTALSAFVASQVYFFEDWITRLNEFQIHIVWEFQRSSIFIGAVTLRVDPFKVLNWRQQHAATHHPQNIKWKWPHPLHSTMGCCLSMSDSKRLPVILLHPFWHRRLSSPRIKIREEEQWLTISPASKWRLKRSLYHVHHLSLACQQLNLTHHGDDNKGSSSDMKQRKHLGQKCSYKISWQFYWVDVEILGK